MMDTMCRSIARLLAVSAAFFSIQALAQSTTPGTTMGPGQAPAAEASRQSARSADFDQLDANKDGSIDKREASSVPGLLAAFDKADADRDGKLNKTEFRIAEAQMKRS
jgi:hypothetical protein